MRPTIAAWVAWFAAGSAAVALAQTRLAVITDTNAVMLAPNPTNFFSANSNALHNALGGNIPRLDGENVWTGSNYFSVIGGTLIGMHVATTNGSGVALTTNANLVTIANDPDIVPNLQSDTNTFTGAIRASSVEAELIGGPLTVATATVGTLAATNLTVGGVQLNTNVWVVPPPTGNAATDMANIQYAMDMATNLVSGASYGGVTEIILAGGQYNLSGSLTCRMHGVTIRGQGMERTRLYQNSSTAPAFVVSGISGKTWGGASQLWYVTFRDFQVTKTRALASTSTSAAFHFVTPTPTSQQLSRARFENIKVNNFYYGFYVDHAVGVTWINCEAYGCNYSYYLAKCDSAVFVNCFGGDAISSSAGTNLFGVSYSAAWTYKPNAYADGFDLTIIGGEARLCNVVLDAQGGNVSLSGLNVERMPDGPVFWLQSGVDSADIRASRISRDATNNAPIIRMANGVARKTRIHGLDLGADLSLYPPIEIQGATDWLAYTGPQVTATNTATATAYYVPAWRDTGGQISGNGGGLTNIIKSAYVGSISTNVLGWSQITSGSNSSLALAVSAAAIGGPSWSVTPAGDAVFENLTVNGSVLGDAYGITNVQPASLAPGTQSHQTWQGTNTIAAGGDLALGTYNNSSLANGNNANVLLGTNVVMRVSGPTSAFTICGLNGSPNRDGKLAIILNTTGQNMTLAHESGLESVAANRIYTMTGSDRATTGDGAAWLVYIGDLQRWVLISLEE